MPPSSLPLCIRNRDQIRVLQVDPGADEPAIRDVIDAPKALASSGWGVGGVRSCVVWVGYTP